MRAVFRKRPELNAQVQTIFLTSYFEIISDFQKLAKLTFCLTRVKLQKQENNTDTMLMIILIFWFLLKFCQCPFSHPGCNKGSHIAFSCHVLLVSFILKHFLSFSSSSHDLVSIRQFFCRILLHLNLMFPHDDLKLCILVSFSMHHTRRLDVSLPEILTWVTQLTL